MLDKFLGVMSIKFIITESSEQPKELFCRLLLSNIAYVI